MNNSRMKDRKSQRRVVKNLFLRLLNREITGKLGNGKLQSESIRNYPSVFMPNKFVNEAIFEKQLFGYGVLPKRFILRLSNEARSKLTHNSVIIGFSKDFTLWSYTLLERHYYVTTRSFDNSNNENHSGYTIKTLFSTQLWKPIITNEDTINIKSLVDIPLFLIPSTSDENLLSHIGQSLSDLTFFETNVNWNTTNNDNLKESFFAFTKSSSLMAHHYVTLLYLCHYKEFSDYNLGHLHISYKACPNTQGFHPIRNWSKQTESIVLNTGSCLYLIYAHIDKRRLKHAQGLWEHCASSEEDFICSYSGIDVYRYETVDNRELLNLHYNVYKFEIEDHLPNIIREYPQLNNIELDDYSMYIMKTLGNGILLYIIIIGHPIQQNDKNRFNNKQKISFISYLTLDSGKLEIIRINKPEKMAQSQIDSLKEDLNQIKTILSQIQLYEIPKYVFYTNKNVLKGISMPMILHPILPLGICK